MSEHDPMSSIKQGGNGDGTSCSVPGVPPGPQVSQPGDSAEPAANGSLREFTREPNSFAETPSRGYQVLTEAGLKELLYTSCSRDSPEFESIINLYLDQVKSLSEEMASRCCETSSPLKRNFEPSGQYSQLELKHFVRLSPSAIGYPATSWKNFSKEDGEVEPAVQDHEGMTVDSDVVSRIKLKLRITRETHPTPEDLRNDIVLKMIVVEEVNKKDLMGPLRAYLSPDGEVEFHTASPGQKEGLEDYLQQLSEDLDGFGGTEELNFGDVISAITGCSFGANPAKNQLREGETLQNGELADVMASKMSAVVDTDLSHGHDARTGSPAFVPSAACYSGRKEDPLIDIVPVPTEGSTEVGKIIRDNIESQKILDMFGVAPLTTASEKKPPLWHGGVDLTEVFSETDSESDSDDDGDADGQDLPTGADLKILELLRSSSSASNASGMSAYSEDDIEAGLRQLALGKGEEDGDDEDESGESDHSPDVGPRVSQPAVTDYETVRTLESPISKLEENFSLKDLGLQVIDPMGLDVIKMLKNMPDKKISPKKTNKSPSKKCEQDSTQDSAPTEPQPRSKKTEPKQNESAANGNSEFLKKGDSETSLLKNLENIAGSIIPDAKDDKEIGERGQKILPEKTVPRNFGKMPEPVSQGFSRHLASAPGSALSVGPHPHGPGFHGPPHPALGVPLVRPHQWFPMMVHIPGRGGPVTGPGPSTNRGGPATGPAPSPNHAVPPVRPGAINNSTPNNYALEIFSRFPEEFGRHVAHSLYNMDFEQRRHTIESVIDILTSCHHLDRVAPQNGNPQRVQFNPVRPSTRPPFSQTLLSAANQSSQANGQSNFPSQIRATPGFPQSLPTPNNSVQGHSSAENVMHSQQKTPHSQAADPAVLKPGSPPSSSKPESGKTSKVYWEGLKNFKVAKKATKKALSPKFSGAVKNRSFQPSKSAAYKAKQNLMKQIKKVSQERNELLSEAEKDGFESSSSAGDNKMAQVDQRQSAQQNLSSAQKLNQKQSPASEDPPTPKPKIAKGPNQAQHGKGSLPKSQAKQSPGAASKPSPDEPKSSSERPASSGSRRARKAQAWKEKQSGQQSTSEPSNSNQSANASSKKAQRAQAQKEKHPGQQPTSEPSSSNPNQATQPAESSSQSETKKTHYQNRKKFQSGQQQK